MKLTRIHYRLSLSYLLVLVVSMAITTLLFTRFAEHYVEGQLGEQLRSQADFMATFLARYNALPDPSDLPMATHDLQASFAHVLKARLQVANSEGIVMSDTSNREGRQLEVPSLAAALAGEQAPWTAEEMQETVVHATAPIRARGEIIGVLDLSTPLADQSHLQDLRALLFLAFGVSLLVSWTMSALLSRTITRPIARMQAGAQRIANGDLNHVVAPVGHDELSRLAVALNRMARELRSRIEETSTLLESLEEGVVALDAGGAVRFLNSSARRLLDLGQGEVLNRPLQARDLDDVLAECRQRRDLVHRELAAANRRLQLYAVPYAQTEAGSGIMIVLRDVTELRRLEEVRSTFLSSVSHELRTPLTIIKGFAVTLEDGVDPSARRAVAVIDRETDRLTRLVDEVLELSRLRSHRLALSRVPTPADAVVAETVQELQPRAEELKVRLEAKVADDAVTVMADPDRLKQIVMNLVDNGLKYTPEGGHVTVATRVEAAAWELSVSDTGIGIPQEELPFLFERFFRGRDGRKQGGTGLGLAIVKELVDLLEGRIEVSSHTGQGTTIRVALPLAPQDQEPAAREENASLKEA